MNNLLNYLDEISEDDIPKHELIDILEEVSIMLNTEKDWYKVVNFNSIIFYIILQKTNIIQNDYKFFNLMHYREDLDKWYNTFDWFMVKNDEVLNKMYDKIEEYCSPEIVEIYPFEKFKLEQYK